MTKFDPQIAVVAGAHTSLTRNRRFSRSCCVALSRCEPTSSPSPCSLHSLCWRRTVASGVSRGRDSSKPSRSGKLRPVQSPSATVFLGDATSRFGLQHQPFEPASFSGAKEPTAPLTRTVKSGKARCGTVGTVGIGPGSYPALHSATLCRALERASTRGATFHALSFHVYNNAHRVHHIPCVACRVRYIAHVRPCV